MSARDLGTAGTSLAKAPGAIAGLVLLAYGLTGLVFGGSDFAEQAFDGTVDGDTWLGLEANGWTNALILGSGALLLASAPLHWAVKGVAMLAGLVLGAVALIALGDGDDALGIFAVNEPMKIALGAASTLLLVTSMLPRLGRGRIAEDERGALHEGDGSARQRAGARSAEPGYAAPAVVAPPGSGAEPAGQPVPAASAAPVAPPAGEPARSASDGGRQPADVATGLSQRSGEEPAVAAPGESQPGSASRPPAGRSTTLARVRRQFGRRRR